MKAIEKHVVKYGLVTTLSLILLFFVIQAIGLAHITELRFLNALFMSVGVFLSIRHFRERTFDVSFNYLTGIATGFFTGLVTAVSFSIFVGLYVYTNPSFLAAIVLENPHQDFLNPLTSAMVIFIEALASGFLFSYCSMQYLKQEQPVIPPT